MNFLHNLLHIPSLSMCKKLTYCTFFGFLHTALCEERFVLFSTIYTLITLNIIGGYIFTEKGLKRGV